MKALEQLRTENYAVFHCLTHKAGYTSTNPPVSPEQGAVVALLMSLEPVLTGWAVCGQNDLVREGTETTWLS